MAKRSGPEKVRKRDGTVVPFKREKIRYAIERAAYEALQDKNQSATVAVSITKVVIGVLASRYRGRIPSVEGIQDTIEEALMDAGHAQVARAYILYRHGRTELRMAKSALGQRDDLKLSLNAMEVLKRRYLLKDDHRTVIETPSELFGRVASYIARAEEHFKSSLAIDEVEEQFYRMMRDLEFMPNSPTLMNAGTSLGQLSACFVIPVEDSMDGIFDAL